MTHSLQREARHARIPPLRETRSGARGTAIRMLVVQCQGISSNLWCGSIAQNAPRATRRSSMIDFAIVAFGKPPGTRSQRVIRVDRLRTRGQAARRSGLDAMGDAVNLHRLTLRAMFAPTIA